MGSWGSSSEHSNSRADRCSRSSGICATSESTGGGDTSALSPEPKSSDGTPEASWRGGMAPAASAARAIHAAAPVRTSSSRGATSAGARTSPAAWKSRKHACTAASAACSDARASAAARASSAPAFSHVPLFALRPLALTTLRGVLAAAGAAELERSRGVVPGVVTAPPRGASYSG